jgi:hypothetical protein
LTSTHTAPDINDFTSAIGPALVNVEMTQDTTGLTLQTLEMGFGTDRQAIPNGGLRAWLVVLGGFLNFAAAFGISALRFVLLFVICQFS